VGNETEFLCPTSVEIFKIRSILATWVLPKISEQPYLLGTETSRLTPRAASTALPLEQAHGCSPD